MTNRRECVVYACALVLALCFFGSALPLRAQDTVSKLSQEIGWEISTGNIQAALVTAHRAILEFPQSATLTHLLAVAESQGGLIGEARKSFGKSIQQDPTIPQNYYDLALLDMQEGDYVDATTMIRTYLQITPQSAKAHLMLGIAYRKQYKDQLAMQQLKEALAESPSLPQAHYNLGKIYQNQGDNEDALEEFRDELGVNPDFYDVYWSAGYSEIAVKHYKAAEALFRRGTELKPLAYQAYFGLAHLYLTLNQLSKAESELETVIALDPQNIEAHIVLAGVYTQLGKTLEAKREELVVETLKDQAKQAEATPAH